MWLLLTLVASCIVLVLRIAQVLGKNSVIFEKKKRTLFVIAHPDDESMFFAPTLLYLNDQKQQVVLLCLSEGDHYGQGHLRKQELVRACEYLGLQSDSIIIVNDKHLPDDPLVHWDSVIIAQYVMKIVHQYNIERVITFDEGGVSGHNNHIAIYKAIRSHDFSRNHVTSYPPFNRMLCINGELSQGKEVYTLETVHILRKYMSFLEALFTRQQLVTKDKRQQRYYIITSYSNWCLARRALETHKSQMVWYRQLYRNISSYLIVNRYTIINH